MTRVEAVAIHLRLASEVILRPLAADGPASPRFAAGVDVAYLKDGSFAWAVAVVMNRRFETVSTSVAEGVPDSPYAPGYLAFREGRLTLETLASFKVRPDLVVLDGHRVVRPRHPFMQSITTWGGNAGTITCSPRNGVHREPRVRLKSGVKPLYLSPGHLVDLPSAVALALVWSSGQAPSSGASIRCTYLVVGGAQRGPSSTRLKLRRFVLRGWGRSVKR